MKFLIRYNDKKGQENKGTNEHHWVVFDGTKEYIVKNVLIDVPSKLDANCCSKHWGVSCDGQMHLDRNTSTLRIVA